MNRQSLSGIAVLAFFAFIVLFIVGELVFGWIGLFG